jgi:hypothetical protein
MVQAKRAVILAAALMTVGGLPVHAEILDATYRGTLVCDRMALTDASLREAIEVTISGGTVRYNEVVRLRSSAAESSQEQGSGSLSGQHIELQGKWEHAGHRYEAKYAGDFVRRSARLKGTQTWTVGDKSMTRNCTGAIKRPLKAFLPRNR